MPSQARTPREEERRFSIRTLLIASVASATAALVTSQFWKGGTPIAAAVTPVIVTIVSEMLHRPTERIATRLTSERDALGAGPRTEAQSARRRPAGSGQRRLPLRAIAVTATLAVLIGVAILTLPELIAGRSFGGGDRDTTIFGGDRSEEPPIGQGGEEPAPSPNGEEQPEPVQTQPETTPTEDDEQPEEAPEPAEPPVDETAPQRPPATTTPQPAEPQQ